MIALEEKTIPREIDIVQEENSVDVSALQDVDRPMLMLLGGKGLDFIRSSQIENYCLVNITSIDTLKIMIGNWNRLRLKHPVKALFVEDEFLSELMNKDIHINKQQSAFDSTPLLVFSKGKKKFIKDLCFAISADDYIFEDISFPMIMSKVSFSRRLRRFGVTKQDAVLKEDKTYKMYFLKRLFDIILSSSFLLLASPVMILVALIIKLESKGPIFYISKRAGNYYRVFDFYKFRSMNADADSKLKELKETSNQYQDGNQFVKIKDDPRITKFGNFIRNTSLDELPQLINVLKGDMSIVGNRPLPLYEAEMLTTDEHAERFLAPAGITGLWQTLKRGKSEMSSEERITLDRIYVRKNSILFDMKLILMTIPALLQSEKV